MDTRIEPIERVVPHRGTLLLVDRVLDWDAESIRVELRVPDESIFHDAEGVPAWVGLEYMAQAIAAWAGCKARASGGGPTIGFLLGTRRYECARTNFRSGSLLRIEARCELLGDNGLGMFACRIVEGGETLATANVSVFEPGDAAAYLETGTMGNTQT